MRGDSLRDFYAKSIALLGLGLLGAIGAAVDYWPTGVAIPRTSALDLRPEGLRPLAEGSLTDVTVEIAPLRASTRVMVSATSHPIIQRVAFKSVTFMPRPAATPAADLQMAPPESFSGLQAADATVDLTTLDWQPEVFQVTSIGIVPVESPNADQKGFFAGWGSSIVDGASKVGSTAANGLQAAGGAIKGGVLGLLHVGRRDDKQRRQTGAMLVENFPR